MSGNSLAILVPSRGRPHNLRRLIDAVANTATGQYRIYTYIDDDDPTADAYRGLDVIPTLGPRIFFAAALNVCAKAAVEDDATHLAMFGDDVVPETVGWDEALIEALGDQLGVAYGDDGLRDKHAPDLPTHFVTQAETFARLGWLALPTLRHLFCDDVARALGQGLGNFPFVPVKISHLHRWNRKAPDDLTYREANDKVKREVDRLTFVAWRDGEGYKDALRKLTA